MGSARLTGRRWTKGIRANNHGEFNEMFNVEDNWRDEEDGHGDVQWVGSAWLEINSAKVTGEHWEQLLDRQGEQIEVGGARLPQTDLLENDRLVPDGTQVDCARTDPAQDIGVLHQGKYYDEITGEPLDWKKVQQARREEIEHFRKMEVMAKAPWSQAIERTGNPQYQSNGWT